MEAREGEALSLTCSVLRFNFEREHTKQSRDRQQFTQSESRIPIPKARRATGESVNRPNHGQSKLGSSESSSSKTASAPSTPRPIPKNNKKTIQPSSMSSSYTFDDSIDNPFLPSTPPAFTPSMERTGLAKPESSKESSSSFTEVPKQSTSRKPVTSNTPAASAAIADEKPPNPPFARSRNGSTSSLPKPRHEDMILPAVARRIKEEGLFDHDVIAYSDDYNAPLYKLPPASSSINNPFASYDREKAASSTSLGQQKSPLSKVKNETGSYSDQILAPSPDIPDSPNASSRQAGAPKTETQSRQRQSSEGQSGANGRDDVPTSSNNTSEVVQPERPRRARRNTNHQAQQEHANSNDEYKPRRQRRPTMSESRNNEDAHGANNWNDSREPQIASESRRNESAKINNNNNNNNNNNSEYHQNSSSQVGGSNQFHDAHTQRQGRYQQNNGDYDRSRQENHGRQRDAYNDRRGEYDSHQANAYAQNGSYAHQSNGGRYDDRQGWNNAQQRDYNAQQGGYNAQQGSYSAQQGGYNAQHGYSAQQDGHNATHGNYNNSYNGRNASLQPRTEMVQIEMSEIAPSVGGDVTKVDPKDDMKKKGKVCCVIM
ncbi:hypothetical protein BGZ80_006302 [Entomortierella chlamydospora]|uniref:Uncharacterized protein n=1 Tax=Entomortierella chlamydospora TaxID=101097 RepID=A0A9P6T213_9FUNG|nr:hypothetical protein BGZ80_006302 [Entomortierella chlamydospora]